MQRELEKAVYLDFGDVIHDHNKAEAIWQKTAGEYYSSRFSGEPDRWIEASKKAYSIFIDGYRKEFFGHPEKNYNAFVERAFAAITERMFREMERDLPKDEDPFDILLTAYVRIAEHVRAEHPGAIDALHRLKEIGCRLYTSSGHRSEVLGGYLRALEIEDLFEKHYGPDLVNSAKEGPLFYEKLFADSGESASNAIVVDDKALVLRWAKETGATCIQVAPAEHGPTEFRRIAGLYELPELIAGL